MARVRLNRNVIASLSIEKDGQWVTDAEVPQLVVRLSASSKTYVARFSSKATGKRIQEIIGLCDNMSADTAREKVRRLVGGAEGPAGSKTLKDAYDLWEGQYTTELSARHVADFQQAWRDHIEPHLGNKKLSRLMHSDVQAWYQLKRKECPKGKGDKVRDTPYSAAAVNRWVAYVSRLCALARMQDWMVRNPCEKVEKSTPNRRVTIFTTADIKELSATMSAKEKLYPVGVAILRFLMIFPCRGKEARGMTWDDLDLVAGTFTIPAHRYKTDRDKVFGLGPQQIALLKSIKSKDWSRTYVFPSPKNYGEPMRYEHQRDVWERVRPKKLGAHTLRKTIGSALLNDGVPLEVVSQLLGHSSTAVTQQVYAHLAPQMAAKHLARWPAILADDMPQTEDDDPELTKMLRAQAAMSVAQEYK